MAEGVSMFEVGSRVQFKDGDNTRVGFVTSPEAANETHPDGCSVLFKIRETGQMRLSRIALTDLKESKADAYAFKVGAEVNVTVAEGQKPIVGKVFERAPMNQDTFEPLYAILFKDDAGQTALAWWVESKLSATN